MPNFQSEREIIAGQVRIRHIEMLGVIFQPTQPIPKLEACVTGPGRGPERAPKSGWKKFQTRQSWGGFDQTTWFRMNAVIPKQWKGRRVVARINPGGGESLAFVNGQPTQGLDRNRDWILLAEKAKGGEKFEITLESVPSTQHDLHHTFQFAELAVMNQDIWDYWWDIKTLLMIWDMMPHDQVPFQHLLDVMDESIKLTLPIPKADAEYIESVRKARRKLQQGLKRVEESHGEGKLVLTGHSHIDTAWLWPLRETQRKCGRTFSTMLNLIEQYPEFNFSCSQPVQYEWVQKYFPEQYKRIKQRAKAGQWEPNGCFWVEPDLNVPSGESLIRQAVYGNRFFRKEFGVHSRVAWTPDTFGYCWALPQILKKAQVDYFVTTKLYWNQFTDFPYSHFMWEAPDGSRIRAVLPSNYNGNIVPDQVKQQWTRNKQKDKTEEFLFPFGWGDGGGGPTPDMLEVGKRLKNVVGMPRCEFGRVGEALDRMAGQCPPENLPVWNGELYFELHRGVQTTHARTKRHNRKCELELRDAEFLSAIALLNGGRYDAATLYEAWKLVLTNQFHDILPGTSINEVYRTTEEHYATAHDLIASVREKALAHLVRKVDTRGTGQPILVVNTLGWDRYDVAEVEVDLPKGPFHVVGPDGIATPHQKTADGHLLFEIELPPLGWAVYQVVEGEPSEAREPAGALKASEKVMENDFLRIRFDAMGRLSSLYDKDANRESIPKGEKGNVLQLFEDRPSVWEAWDIDFNFEEKMWEPGRPESIEILENGPVRAVVRIVRKTEKSTITQDVVMLANSARVEFKTHVDWWDRRTLLKTAFPLDVRSSRATFEVQFGAIERPTHRNRESDLAQFEVPAHRWADLSEGDYGVSLLNDCKYGYDVKDNVLRLSLLRAPMAPDEHADEGEHRFTYAVYPHAGDWRSGTVQEAWELNVPAMAIAAPARKGDMPPVGALAVIDADHVVIDTVKRAEDSDALIIRLYEAMGQRGDVTLSLGRDAKKVSECDLMEENDQALKVKNGDVRFFIKPYEIRTFKIEF